MLNYQAQFIFQLADMPLWHVRTNDPQYAFVISDKAIKQHQLSLVYVEFLERLRGALNWPRDNTRLIVSPHFKSDCHWQLFRTVLVFSGEIASNSSIIYHLPALDDLMSKPELKKQVWAHIKHLKCQEGYVSENLPTSA